MEKIFEKLFDFEKIPTKLIFILCTTSAILLFVPSDFLQKLNLTEFTVEYGKYVGITFIISASFLLVTFITFIFNKIKQKRNEKKIISEIKTNLTKLNYSEILILREFLFQKKSIIQLPFLDETVISLENKMIIYKASNSGTVTIRGQFWPFSISDYAIPEINFQILLLPENPTKEQEQKVYNERPEWAK